MDTATRQQLARELAARLRSHYGTDLVLVGLFGSAARGDDTPWSDLDLLVVLRDGAPLPNWAFVLQGVSVEVQAIHEPTLLAELGGAGPAWVRWMGVLAELKPLLGDRALVKRWQAAGLAMDATAFRLAVAPRLPGLVLAPYGRIRSAAVRNQPLEAHLAAVNLLDDLLIALSLLNRRWVTQSGSAGFHQSKAFLLLPDSYVDLVPALYEAHELEMIVSLAGQVMAAYWRLLASNDAIIQNYQRVDQVPM
ncbi:MAG: nucleotidyltransferase family protein [Oscillochloridaceae bacterium umkhey_bin13]